MSDREMLELAAKAAGYSVRCVGDGSLGGNVVFYIEPEQLYWNPFTDDGDALRLAVELCMSITNTAIRTSILARPDPDFGDWMSTTEPHNGDSIAATRRAIVRAAAEIGRHMP